MFSVADPTSPDQPAPSPAVDVHAEEWERTYATFNHLSLLTFHVLMPVIPALAMWLIKRDRSPFVDDHGREAVNFQISLMIYALILIPVVGALTCGVGWVLYIALYGLAIYGMVKAAMAANRGQYYRYPACIRFLT